MDCLAGVYLKILCFIEILYVNIYIKIDNYFSEKNIRNLYFDEILRWWFSIRIAFLRSLSFVSDVYVVLVAADFSNQNVSR